VFFAEKGAPDGAPFSRSGEERLDQDAQLVGALHQLASGW
jgi:hypothetical protein